MFILVFSEMFFVVDIKIAYVCRVIRTNFLTFNIV
jgi:hypothetical protein